MSAARAFQLWFDKVTTQCSARAFREAERMDDQLPPLAPIVRSEFVNQHDDDFYSRVRGHDPALWSTDDWNER